MTNMRTGSFVMEPVSLARTALVPRQGQIKITKKWAFREWHLPTHITDCQNRTQDREVLSTVCDDPRGVNAFDV